MVRRRFNKEKHSAKLSRELLENFFDFYSDVVCYEDGDLLGVEVVVRNVEGIYYDKSEFMGIFRNEIADVVHHVQVFLEMNPEIRMIGGISYGIMGEDFCIYLTFADAV